MTKDQKERKRTQQKEYYSTRGKMLRDARRKEVPERSLYYSAKQRCDNPNDKDYHNYGGRGIKFLFKSYENFIQELGNRPSKLHSIDRINNNSHYEPGNIKWATKSEQMENRRSIVELTQEIVRLKSILDLNKISY